MASDFFASSKVAGGSGTPAAFTPSPPIGASVNSASRPTTALSTLTACAVTSLPMPSPGRTAIFIICSLYLGSGSLHDVRIAPQLGGDEAFELRRRAAALLAAEVGD